MTETQLCKLRGIPMLLEKTENKTIVSNRKSNPASNTDQPTRVYSSIYSRGALITDYNVEKKNEVRVLCDRGGWC